MESAAIDFARIRREERRKARLRKQEVSSVSEKPPTTTASLPSWNLPNLHTKHVQCLNSDAHLLSADPPYLYYIDNFLQSYDFAAGLVSWLQALPEANHHTRGGGGADEYSKAHGKWTKLRYAARRVALFDARVAPLPEPLQQLMQVLQETVWQHIPADATTNIGPINHILINQYTETQGILGHTDGPAYDPCTATLSLESDAVLHFTPSQPRHEQDVRQVWLAANSLVVFTHRLYREYQHSLVDEQTLEHLTESCWNGTPGQAVRRGPLRYSLTFRCKTPLKA